MVYFRHLFSTKNCQGIGGLSCISPVLPGRDFFGPLVLNPVYKINSSLCELVLETNRGPLLLSIVLHWFLAFVFCRNREKSVSLGLQTISPNPLAPLCLQVQCIIFHAYPCSLQKQQDYQLLAANGVSPGETSATQQKKFHIDDIKSVCPKSGQEL